MPSDSHSLPVIRLMKIVIVDIRCLIAILVHSIVYLLVVLLYLHILGLWPLESHKIFCCNTIPILSRFSQHGCLELQTENWKFYKLLEYYTGGCIG